MLAQDMIDIPLNSLPVLKLLPGEYILTTNCETLYYDENALVTDEKGSLLGKILLALLDKDIPIRELRSQIEPCKETILKDASALDLIENFNGHKNKNKIVYVTDKDNRLIGAISCNSRVMDMLFKMKDFVFFPSIFDALHEAVLIIDHSGTIVYINHAYNSIVGASGAKLIGRKMEEVEPTSLCLKVLMGHPPVINKMYTIQSLQVEVLANITPFYVNGKIQGVINIFRNIHETISLGSELEKMRDAATTLHNHFNGSKALPQAFNDIIGKNKYFRQALVLAAHVCTTDATVMIRGDSGTGKEVVAEAIQKCSSRKDGPFIKVNCASIPENLLESELFGYEEGAFTGAKKGGKRGKFEFAHKGTLFLDEVGDMSLTMQAKLLRVLQEKEIERIGGSQSIKVDVRLISATNRDLETMVMNKEFRDDLYYRLNVIPIFLPPLVRRKDDIPLLVEHFLKIYSKEHDKGDLFISSEVMNMLISHNWPGNIRELKNVIEHAVILSEGGMIKTKDLPILFKKNNDSIAPPIGNGEAIPEQVELLEKQIITKALKNYENKSDAIKALGISRRTFYAKLKKYNIYE
ncbi:sigma-54 interaction domain-containing protein [Desulfitobacterium chlororespirans]|uniref:PAS domain S-box-containing protein n=1 Tax=Desulfitobacterium chlororespirans DSM 11544 TaxID=1121395 RepID=A0A1M7UG83_9FIRM|nr:sigma 54-interacting transcriptional regulator [Desulfitobacterium chlororespirans]SHN81887.1 PAS domain S-box-containing protein [Desulfitobacterium chlororespirans DSM 11544]